MDRFELSHRNEILTRKTKDTLYDKKRIIDDYQKGLSLPKLRKKYGISISYAADIIRKANVMRTLSQAILLSTSNQTEWHRLIRIGHRKDGSGSLTRMLSIPFELLSHLNFEGTDEIQGKWVIQGNHLVLELRKAKEVGV